MIKVDVAPDLVHGDVEEGFGAVADAFRRNFAAGGEVGAACAIHLEGRKVVDLWGGYRDGHRRLPWERDTMVPMFSVTKGMAGVAMAVAHGRGLFDLDEPVARYWPEFAAAGKEAVTVRQLLAHQAGVPVLDRRVALAELGDEDALGRLLAAQRPMWEPGTRHGYHAVTLAWYESQLLSRVDLHGRTLGRYFAEEVARPLGADFHIGLPDDVPDERLAAIHSFRPPEMLLHLGAIPGRMLVGMLSPRGVLGRSMKLVPELMDPDAFNRREVLRPEIPSVNGTGEVRAVAAVYGAVATGDEALDIGPATAHALAEPADVPPGGARDVALRVETAFSMGFLKPCPALRYGSSPHAFGTPGAGGSFAFADPDAEVGYAYAMNRLGFHFPVDPRELAMRSAFYDVIGGPPQR